MANHTKRPPKPSTSAARPQVSSPAPGFEVPDWMRSAIALTGLLILVLTFFWPILMGRAFLWEDFSEHVYPFRTYTAVELRTGRFPLWNPYLFGGLPFFAMIDTAVLYPLNWLFISLVKEGTLSFLVVEWHTIAHVLLLGMGMYAFCRSLGISRVGAFASSVTVMLSGTIVHHVIHAPILDPMVWLPFVFLLLVRALDRLSLRLAVATGAVWSLAIVAGHPQVFVYIAYAMGLYTVWCLIERVITSLTPWPPLHSVERGPGGEVLRLMGVIAVVVAVGVGLTAVALLPMSELIGFSQRPNVSYETAVSYALAPQQLITLLMPDFFGRTDPARWDYWGPGLEEYGHFWETYTYVGILPLLLAGAAVVVKRHRLTWFFGLLAVLTLLLSLGGATPVYRVLYAALPGLDKFRAPGRFVMLFGFAVATLVGFGLDALQAGRDRDPERGRLRWYVLITMGVTLIGLAAYMLAGDGLVRWLAWRGDLRQRVQDAMAAESWRCLIIAGLSFGLLIAWQRVRKWGRLLTAAMIGLIVADLFTAGYEFNLGDAGPEDLYPHDDLVQFLQQQQAEEGGRANLRNGPYMMMRRNAGMLFRIYTLEGYASPLRLSRTLPPVEGGRALDLMNVTYRIQVDEQAQTARLVPNLSVLPRAFVVRQYVVARDMDAVGRALKDSTFNYRTTVTLDDRPSPDIPADSAAAPEQPAIDRYEPSRMTVSVDMTRPGLLVVSEVYYPAWRAYVDGRPSRVYQADGTLRAVSLPAGRHTVEFRYESRTLRMGSIISALSLLVVIGAAVLSWRSAGKQR